MASLAGKAVKTVRGGAVKKRKKAIEKAVASVLAAPVPPLRLPAPEEPPVAPARKR